jgi:hypothetical protein
MHGLLGEQRQDGFADEPAPRLDPEAPGSPTPVVAVVASTAAAARLIGVGVMVVGGMRAASMGATAIDSVEQRVIDPLGAGGCLATSCA